MASSLTCLVLMTLAFPACLARVTVEPLSVTYLPYEVTPKAKYELFSAAVEQIAFDPVSQMAYGIGEPFFFHHFLVIFVSLQ